MRIKIIIILFLGLCFYNIAFVFLFDKIYPENIDLEIMAEIISIKEEKDNCDKYIVKVKSNNIIKNSKNTKLIMYVDKSYNFFPGDIVWVRGEFYKAEEARNYKGFNYRSYLKQDKIYGIISTYNVNKVSRRFDIYYFVGKLQNSLFEKIELLYKNDSKEFLKGILLGNDYNLDKEIKKNFKSSSLSHILAISGMHISYIVIGLNFFLKKFIKSIHKRNYIVIFLLFVFAIITGLQASCMRAIITYSMILLASNLYKKNNFYISLFISFIILILINPFNLFNIGMWLSYFATLGIVLFSKIIKKIIKLKYIKIKNNLVYKIIDLFSISISAQILIFPIIIYCFNKYSLTFFISNILISFIIGPVLAIGYISILISYIFLPFSKFLSIIENTLIKLLLIISKFCSEIPLSDLKVITPNFFVIIIYYLILIYLIILFHKHKFLFFRILLNSKKSKKIIISIYKKIVSCLVLISIIQIISFSINSGNLRIYFVDVGQGDCTVIITPKGKNIIIDGGDGGDGKYDYGENIVLPYLLDRKISKIEYMIISHFDSDHVGGLLTVMEEIKVEQVIISKQVEDSENYKKFKKIVKEKKIKVIMADQYDRLEIEKNLYFDILWPNNSNLINENVLNNNSIVCKLNYKNFSILFTGDIEEIAEKQILQTYKNNFKFLNSTVLKVGHHGSKTSSIQDFIEVVKPRIALIGVGKNNNFGHPNEEVIKRLENLRGKNISNRSNGRNNDKCR